jgi:hypothetical protein
MDLLQAAHDEVAACHVLVVPDEDGVDDRAAGGAEDRDGLRRRLLRDDDPERERSASRGAPSAGALPEVTPFFERCFAASVTAPASAERAAK